MTDLSAEFARSWANDVNFVELAKSLYGDEVSVADVADEFLGENNPVSKVWTPDKHPRDTSGKFKVGDAALLAVAGASLALGGRYVGRAYEAGRLARTLNSQARTARNAADYTGNIAHAIENAGKTFGGLKLEDLTKHVEDLKAAGVAYTDEQAQALLEAPANAKAFEELTGEHAKVFANASEHQRGLVTEYLGKRNAALRTVIGNALKGTAAGALSSTSMEALKTRRDVNKRANVIWTADKHPRTEDGKFTTSEAASYSTAGIGSAYKYRWEYYERIHQAKKNPAPGVVRETLGAKPKVIDYTRYHGLPAAIFRNRETGQSYYVVGWDPNHPDKIAAMGKVANHMLGTTTGRIGTYFGSYLAVMSAVLVGAAATTPEGRAAIRGATKVHPERFSRGFFRRKTSAKGKNQLKRATRKISQGAADIKNSTTAAFVAPRKGTQAAEDMETWLKHWTEEGGGDVGGPHEEPFTKGWEEIAKSFYEGALKQGMNEERAASLALEVVAKGKGKLIGYGLLAGSGLTNAAGIGTGIHASDVKRRGGTLPYRPLLGAGAGINALASAGQGLAELGGAVLEGRAGGKGGASLLATAGIGDLLGAYGLGKYYMAQQQQAQDTNRHLFRDAAATGVEARDKYSASGSLVQAGKVAAGSPTDYTIPHVPAAPRSGGAQIGAVKDKIVNSLKGPHRPPSVHAALGGVTEDAASTPNHWDDWFDKHPEKRKEYQQDEQMSKAMIPHPFGTSEWMAAYDKLAEAANKIYPKLESGEITKDNIKPEHIDAVRNALHNTFMIRNGADFERIDPAKDLKPEPQIEGSDWAFATHPDNGFGVYEYPHPDQAKMTFHFWDKSNIRRDSHGRFTFSDGVQKSHDVVWEGEISKIDTDKRQVFGWASVTQLDGTPIVDRQGDYITPDEMEKAAYDYVLTSRVGGDMHRRVTKGEEDSPHHASDMIESFVVTPEKLSKMGLPEDALPTGWWVGYKINDETVWQSVKKGERKAFSIHGRGRRTETSPDSISKDLSPEDEEAREIFCKIFYLADPHERVELLQMAEGF